ncbi:MAG: hypothetical protein FWE68_03490 [Defluviitaleaceae bacterium]|nr:hypothetical protein [Defluviitaleaceae bacterium]
MDGWINSIVESMFRYIGQTVTIFTTSGGLSGSGFTGVLLTVDCNVVRLLADVGAAPSCPIGSDCTCGPIGGCCVNFGPCGTGFNPLGAVCVIPTRAIACFTHNAI